MKLLMLNNCYEIGGGANLTSGKIYDVKKAIVYKYDEESNYTEIPYENATTFQRNNMKKGFTIINDDGKEEFVEDEFYYICYKVFETNNELAHYLIDNVEGLEDSIVNLAMRF